MNIYSILAFIMSFSVLFIGLKLSTDDLRMFLDIPSIFIVVGGTIAATAVSFQLDRLMVLIKIFFYRVIMGKKTDYRAVIIEMMKISDAYSKGESLEGHINKTKDLFLKDALILVNDDIMSEEELFVLLDDRANNMYYTYSEEANKIKAVAKYPPAFGMIGTTIGMIVLLGNLGGADALKKMGPAMAVCLITTLYGCIIANMAVMPVGENLIDSAKEIYLKNKIIVEGMKLLVNKTNPVVLAEKLNTFLSPSQRLDWKKVLGK
jgi:chemotaxis protein MotA